MTIARHLFLLESYLVSHNSPQTVGPLLRHSLGHRHRGDTSWLGAQDVAEVKVTRVQVEVKDELRHLGCLSTTGLKKRIFK